MDKDSGLVNTVVGTSANIHDVTQTENLLTGEYETVNGDAGCTGADKRETAVVLNKQGKKIKYQINRRPSQLNKLRRSGKYAAKKREHQNEPTPKS